MEVKVDVGGRKLPLLSRILDPSAFLIMGSRNLEWSNSFLTSWVVLGLHWKDLTSVLDVLTVGLWKENSPLTNFCPLGYRISVNYLSFPNSHTFPIWFVEATDETAITA